MAHQAPPGPNGSSARAAPRRAQLTRETVVSAGFELVDESGAAGLTMRRLAGRLGVEAMSLYAHVEGKDSLLGAIVDQVLAELLAGEDPAWAGSGRGWQESLRRLAEGFRDLAVRHPRAFDLVVHRPAAAAWLRPPLRTLGWAERFLDRLVTSGFSDQDAVTVYRAYNAFLIGILLPEASVVERGMGEHAPSRRTTARTAQQAASFPTVARLGEALRQKDSAQDFDDALTRLLDGFAARVASPRRERARAESTCSPLACRSGDG